MRERGTFERELRDLREKDTSGGFETLVLSTPDQDERGSITVNGFRFPGTSSQAALVFAGVHGTEPEGVVMANELVATLKAAAARGVKPGFTTFIIPRLFSKARNRDKRNMLVAGREIEPNRNFPAPGESYEYARLRGQRRTDKAELLNCQGKKLTGDKVMHRMMAETRILLQLIEQEKPVRAASIHSHSLIKTRGDAPGIFLDPRGLFNEHTDTAFTNEGRADDALAMNMLGGMLAALKLPLKTDRGKDLTHHPFQGNLADASGAIVAGAKASVHYTSTAHPCGTSFGGWAPAPEHAGSRKGITTITIELPRFVGATAALNEVIRIHNGVLAKTFLGLP